jgi:uncharacterized integral membrane protein
MFETALIVASMGLCVGGILISAFVLVILIATLQEGKKIEKEIQEAEKALSERWTLE